MMPCKTSARFKKILPLYQFYYHSAGAAAAVANTNCAILPTVLPQHIDERHQNAGATTTQRVAKRHGPAMYINPLRVKLHAAGIFNSDNGKSFIQLKISDISER